MRKRAKILEELKELRKEEDRYLEVFMNHLVEQEDEYSMYRIEPMERFSQVIASLVLIKYSEKILAKLRPDVRLEIHQHVDLLEEMDSMDEYDAEYVLMQCSDTFLELLLSLEEFGWKYSCLEHCAVEDMEPKEFADFFLIHKKRS